MLDKTGFKRKRFADLFAESEAKAKETFGEKINTSERSPLGIILRIFAWALSRLWQLAEDVYNSAYPNTANGTSLFRLGPFGGIQQIQAQKASGQITLTGTPNYTQQAGFRVSNGSIVFETTEPITLGGDGKGTVSILAVQPGRQGNLPAGTITTIVNPNGSITAVSNPVDTTGGREAETEKEFRERFAISSEGRGVATTASIRAALLKLSGVRAATVIENYSTTADSSGRPPKSFEAFVLGGDVDEIGKTILNTKAAGIEPYGTTSVTIQDDAGYSQLVRYTPASEILVWLRFTITTDNSFPSDGVSQLKTAAISYIGGEDADGVFYIGLNMGDDVTYSRLIAIAYGVVGITDVAVEISTNGTTWMKANIAIAPNEVAQIVHTRITVVQT